MSEHTESGAGWFGLIMGFCLGACLVALLLNAMTANSVYCYEEPRNLDEQSWFEYARNNGCKYVTRTACGDLWRCSGGGDGGNYDVCFPADSAVLPPCFRGP